MAQQRLPVKDVLACLDSNAKGVWDELTDEQKNELEPFGELVHVNLSTIEKCGGGSARCMIAEIHLPKEVATH